MLYIVATPIGNLKDITLRAIEQLKVVDYILCEDTRTSSVLLNNYNINKQLISYHKFNEKEQLNKIITDLKNGADIALVSDSGMPSISDPGQVLVKAVIENGIKMTVLPGATALINAFVLSGFDYPFTFVGFLPNKTSDKKELLKELKEYTTTLIFYASPYDIKKDINDLYSMLGNRKIAIVRELTKTFEEVEYTTLEQGYTKTIKGEFVLVVEGKVEDDNPLNALTEKEHLDFYLNLGYDKRYAIEMVAKDRSVKKSDIYKIAHKD